MAMKYIAVRRGGSEAIFVFDRATMHAHFARALGIAREHIVGAGFVEAVDGVLRCVGVSSSLAIASRGETDTLLLLTSLRVADR